MRLKTLLYIFVCTVWYCTEFANPAAAETIRVPWPIWVLVELFRIGNFAFWAFIGLIVFVPLKKMLLGAVLAVGGAFLPDIPRRGSNGPPGAVDIELPHAKISFKGAPRYAVLVVGILIVLEAIWEGFKASG